MSSFQLLGVLTRINNCLLLRASSCFLKRPFDRAIIEEQNRTDIHFFTITHIVKQKFSKRAAPGWNSLPLKQVP